MYFPFVIVPVELLFFAYVFMVMPLIWDARRDYSRDAFHPERYWIRRPAYLFCYRLAERRQDRRDWREYKRVRR